MLKFMLMLQGAEPTDAMTAYLAALGDAGLVIDSLRLAPAPGATLVGPPSTVVHDDSTLRAVWVLRVPTRAHAVSIARDIPGETGTIEVREAWLNEEFGGPPDPDVPPPSPPRAAGTTRYLALLDSDARSESGAMPDGDAMKQMDVYCGELIAGGIMLGGLGLKASSKGTRVRRSAAQRDILDGPFAESKELVAGYMVLQARDLDEAIDRIRPWLAVHTEVLGVPRAAIEVRALVG